MKGEKWSAPIGFYLEGRCSIHLSYGRMWVVNISVAVIYEALSDDFSSNCRMTSGRANASDSPQIR
jgi:hypothetical protein